MTSLTAIEPIYVVDTNALIWHLTDPQKLTELAGSIFAAAEDGNTRLLISAVVVAELYYANRKWRLFDDFNAAYQRLKAQPYFQFVPFSEDDVLDFDGNQAIPEMHDRIIVGLARRMSAPLLTVDQVITASGVVKIAW
ncbi:MAG: PIN domain-containing protein [Anaerolineae bacterium]|nr:PIN domain-containing protein [Anaerolineae bacterium]